ncbi:group I intron-associated PD-(D/E)XK endonuclease [Bacillus safensis]|uniref:group I intron-associated PD-(D/E)XK endonuclease n=1 Tax=Bacillus safensis TaxID=561879 RepID=UPI00397A8ED4
MAHKEETIGKFAELIARAALMAAGWSGVSKPETEEPYDILAAEPVTGAIKRIQVKTIRDRRDSRGCLTVSGRKNTGQAYTKSDTDYFIGVLIDDHETKAYMFECRNITDYWMPRKNEGARAWHELKLNLDRGFLAALENEEEAV